VSKTEQRVELEWQRVVRRMGKGRRATRATAAGNPPPSLSRGGWLENPHVVHNRRHSAGRVVTGGRRDLHHRLIRPRVIGRRDRAVPRGTIDRTTRTGIAIAVTRPAVCRRNTFRR